VNVTLALVGVLLAGASGVLAAIFGVRKPQRATAVSVGAMLMGAACGILAAIRVLAGYGDVGYGHTWSIPGGAFDLRLDAIAGIFLVQVFLIGALGSVYAIGYWRPEQHAGCTGRLRIFYGLMVAGMALLVMANNSVLFLVGWEIMALAAFLALTADDRSAENRESGFVYLVATRAGTLALIAMFALLHTATASFSLPAGSLAASSPLGSAVFCLGLVGFGLKAGVMPLHIWLPAAHANAPTHVSALMSGVMIKMGIYGLIRLGSFFGQVPLWWGIALFGLGVVSAVLGVAFALGQHDLKRLLAYHSVENIGIIVMGLGLALIGRATARTDLVVFGLAGALLHTFNHGLFKALLFFGAGSVIAGTNTREIDQMGGLAKRLPFTAMAFLVGAAAICGLPPLNGFISELFLYLGMLKGGALGGGTLGTLLMFGVPILALVGALAVACFVKVHGVIFLGEPRSTACCNAQESPSSMLYPMAILAMGCITIGAAPWLVLGVLERAIGGWQVDMSSVSLSKMVPVVPLTWANFVLLIAVLVVALVVRRWVPKPQLASGPTWDCGYVAPSPRMQYTASSIAEWLVGLFSAFLRPQTKSVELTETFPDRSHFESRVPEVVLELAVLPALRWLLSTANWFRWIQPGRTHLYIVYILVALIVMLFVWH
jgi:hydrogenase-4 component B